MGGFLAVLLYQKDSSKGMEPLTRDDCTQLGIFTGLISAVAGVIIQYLVIAAFGDVMIEMMMRIVERMNVEMPPEYYELIETAKTAERSLFSFILDIFFMGLINTLFAFLGALIGWKVFQPKPVQ